MLANDPIPGAAMQFAEALAKSMRHSPFNEEVTAYWRAKLRILAVRYGIPTPFVDNLTSQDRPSPDSRPYRGLSHMAEARNASRGTQNTEVPTRPSLALRLALIAAAKTFDPLSGTGVLGFSPLPAETPFFREKLDELYRAVDDCEARSLELLGGLLAVALKGLQGDPVPDAVFVAAGLPESVPTPDY